MQEAENFYSPRGKGLEKQIKPIEGNEKKQVYAIKSLDLPTKRKELKRLEVKLITETERNCRNKTFHRFT